VINAPVNLDANATTCRHYCKLFEKHVNIKFVRRKAFYYNEEQVKVRLNQGCIKQAKVNHIFPGDV